MQGRQSAIAAIPLILILIGLPLSYADSVIATIPDGNDPEWISVNPVLNKVYVSSESSKDVTVINGATDVTIGAPITVGGFMPEGIGVNSVTNKIYVALNDGNAVDVIDGATDTLTGTSIPVGSGPR